MKTLLGQDQEKRDHQHQQLVASFSDLKTTVSVLQTSIETERNTRENELKTIPAPAEKIAKAIFFAADKKIVKPEK